MTESMLKTFIVDGSERYIQDLISKLIFISKAKPGHKIDVKSLSYCENSWVDMLYRTFISRGESREVTYEFVNRTMSEAYEAAVVYLSKGGENALLRSTGILIIQNLQEAKIGLHNLILTYQSDQLFSGKLQTMSSMMDTKIVNLKKIANIHLTEEIKETPGLQVRSLEQKSSPQWTVATPDPPQKSAVLFDISNLKLDES